MAAATPQEQAALIVLGVLAGLGLAGWRWQQHRAALQIDAVAIERPQWDEALDTAQSVDVNAAGVEELERLPHIGPAVARRIAAYREAHGPFRSAEELTQVPGIGPKTLDRLRDRIRLSGP